MPLREKIALGAAILSLFGFYACFMVVSKYFGISTYTLYGEAAFSILMFIGTLSWRVFHWINLGSLKLEAKQKIIWFYYFIGLAEFSLIVILLGYINNHFWHINSTYISFILLGIGFFLAVYFYKKGSKAISNLNE